MALYLKPGVSLIGIAPQMAFLLAAARDVYDEYGYNLIITCGTEGKHGDRSRHFTGMALDFRTERVGIDIEEAKEIAALMQKRLGAEFDIVAEEDHIHGEFDPKVGVNL